MTRRGSIGGDPQVSIVVATYNLSGSLRWTIESAIRQELPDWEMIVVGDACTDDTVDVVAGFGDERISFRNLRVNCGDQAGPNNVGLHLARAPIVAFLNHDDLWFADHLVASVEALHARSADLVFAATAAYLWSGNERRSALLDGLAIGGRYSPRVNGFFAASSLVARRAALLEIGGWPAEQECTITPSQELLYRMHRLGHRLWGTGALTVLTIPAGHHQDSYVGGFAESRRAVLLEEMQRPDFRARLLAEQSSTTRRAVGDPARLGSRRERLTWSALQLSRLVGVHPRAAQLALQQGLRPGQLIDQVRRARGLHEVEAPNSGPQLRRTAVLAACGHTIGSTIEFTTDGTGHRHGASGWSAPEAHGVWNDGTEAELVLRMDGPTVADEIELDIQLYARVDVHHPEQRVAVRHRTTVHEARYTDEGPHRLVMRIRPDGHRLVTLRFTLADAWRPEGDPRLIAIGIRSLTTTVV